jgi:hypothetical protein
MSLEWKVPLAAGGVLLLVTGALCWTAYLQVRRSVDMAGNTRLSGLSTQIAVALQSQVSQSSRRAQLIAAQPAIHSIVHRDTPFQPGSAVAAVHAALPTDSNLVAVEVWDDSGRKVAVDGPDAAAVQRLGSEDLLRSRHDPDSSHVGRFQAIGDTVVVPIIAKIAEDGALAGYVVVWQRISSNRRSTTSGQVAAIIGAGGRLLVGSPNGAWTDQSQAVAAPPIDFTKQDSLAKYDGPDGHERMTAYTRVTGVPWVVALEVPADAIRAPAHHFLGSFIGMAALILVIGLAGAWLFIHRMTSPIIELTDAADAMGSGRHGIRVPVGKNDELGRLGAAFNTMADRVEDEVAARTASEEQWRLLFDNNPHPMWLYDRNTMRFLQANDSAIRQYGYDREEFLQMHLRDIYPPAEYGTLDGILSSMTAHEETMAMIKHQRKDGSILDVEARGRPLPQMGPAVRLVVATDITERLAAQRRAHEAEEQLQQSQKMEAIGRLAGGVAHDFNNLLTVISACAEQLMEGALPTEERENAVEISAAASRASALTRQLLTFSRKQIIQPQRLDLSAIVRGVQPMLKRLLFENIELLTNLAPGQAPVIADPSQMEQVILNLVVNASDAMPTGGTLVIETAVVDLDDAYTQHHVEVVAGPYVRLIVSDTGSGMDSATLARIFEPFYTTKAPGMGTGLGLSTVYAIVKQFGGHVWVYSEVGLGTTFKVYLPLAVEESAQTKADVVPLPGVPDATATVLLVEDEDTVRRAVRRMLERSGYTVVEAANGQDGLDVAATHAGTIDAVVTDLMMPGMDGRTFSERLRTTHPDIRVVFTSGYTDDAVIRRGIVDASHRFLQKPFTRDQLARAVHAVLEGS